MTQLLTVKNHGTVAAIALNYPPVNALSHAVRSGLIEVFSSLFADAGFDAIVLGCEGRTFIAGADIREFGKPPLAPDVSELVEFIAGAPKPVIAAIHGTALGGGLELALACHFRVSTPSAQLGFPEVTLGILPGAGGTQRLPRLVGVRAALEMVVGGQLVSAPKARSLGLVDEIVEGDLKAGALAVAERAIAEGGPLRRVSELTAKLDDPKLFTEYEASVAEKCRGFLAPFHCIRAIRAAVELPFGQGLARERELFVELMDSPQAKAQQHAFFAEREVAKVPGLPGDTPTRPLRSAAVVGAGATASEIVRCLVGARIPVTLLASTHEDLERSLAAIRRSDGDAVALGGLERAAADERLSLIRPTLSYDDLSNADLLIEAVPEDLDSKQDALAKFDRVGKPGAIFATSTAVIEVSALAAATRRPEDFVGLHFVSPADAVKLLEAVRARATAPDVYATVMKLGKSLGKISVPVRGFVAGRMLAQRSREAFFLLEEGALPEQVDRALYEFGFPAGPFSDLDRAGLDLALQSRRLTFDRLTARERACNLLDEICAQGRLGRKSGAGFYRYEDGHGVPDPAIEAVIVEHSKRRGIARRKIADAEIVERCLFAMINEAARILEEGVAERPLDIDAIGVHGCGFPRYRGGPMFYADQLGIQVVYDGLLQYQKQVGEEYWTPAPLIQRLARHGEKFHARS